MDAAARALGIDIGGTKLAVGVVDAGTGRVAGFSTCPTEKERGPEHVLDQVAGLVRECLTAAGAGWDDLDGVGVGCVGPLDTRAGIITNPPNLDGWKGFAVVDALTDRLGVAREDIVLNNDAVAAGLGEYHFGAGRDAEVLVYLTVSTGIGGGVLVGGQPLGLRTGNGGELGHMIVVHGGRRCGCGSYGCLEAHASGTGIAGRAAEVVAADPDGAFATACGPTPTAAQVYARSRAGDPVAAEIWAEAMAVLASGVASFMNLYEPDVVVLGGGLTRAGADLLDPVRERATALAYPVDGRSADIRLAALGDEVGVVGAAMGRLGRPSRAT